jgi:hypothetical protein
MCKDRIVILVWLVIVLAFDSTPRVVAASAQIPVSPINPTRADCQQLFSEFEDLTAQAQMEVRQCLQGPAHIAPGTEPSFPNCGIRHTTRAWPQCSQLEFFECEVHRRGDEEYRSCLSRLPEQKGKMDDLLLSNAYGNYKKAKSDFEKASQAITNPGKTLYESLVTNGGDVSDRVIAMFLPGGQLNAESTEQANDLYKLAFKAASKGISQTQNAGVSWLQDRSLNALRAHFDLIESQLDQATADIGRFGNEFQHFAAAKAALSPAFHPTQSAKKREVSLDCSLLRSPQQSRDLQNRDETAWLRLVTKCAN